MLGPNFKEGRQLREARAAQGAIAGGETSLPPTIYLEEDDVLAMEFILSSIHFKADRFEASLTAEMIARIAVQSDKYNFHAALMPWIRSWCDVDRFPLDYFNKLRDMGYGILAAYRFRSPNLPAVSAAFAKDVPPNFAETWKQYELMAHLPEEVWSCLELQITRGLGRLGYLVLKTLDRIRTGSCLDISREDCRFQDAFDHIALYLDGLSQLGIWPSLGPFKVLPVSKAVQLIMELPDVCRDTYYGEDPDSFWGWRFPRELETLCNRADLVLQSIKGFTWPETSSGCEEDDDGVIPLSMDDGWW